MRERERGEKERERRERERRERERRKRERERERGEKERERERERERGCEIEESVSNVCVRESVGEESVFMCSVYVRESVPSVCAARICV